MRNTTFFFAMQDIIIVRSSFHLLLLVLKIVDYLHSLLFFQLWGILWGMTRNVY